MAVNAEERDWVETVNFGSVQEVFKLHIEAQCNVLLAAAAPQLWNSLPYAIRSSPSVASFKKTLKTFLFQKAFLWFYVLFNLVFSRFYAVFYDLSSLGNFYSFSVDKIVLTLFGRFMHFMHVYFMQSWYFFKTYFYI